MKSQSSKRSLSVYAIEAIYFLNFYNLSILQCLHNTLFIDIRLPTQHVIYWYYTAYTTRYFDLN